MCEGNGMGSAFNQMNLCYGLFVDASGTVFFSDYNNHRVMEQSNSSTSGLVIAGNNGAGSASSQLNNPMGIFIDVNNASILYVVDSGNHRVQEWIIGATSGTTIAGTGVAGSALNELDSPRSIIGDASGNVFISDTNNHRIVMWARGATAGVVIAGTSGVPGPLSTTLNFPNGIAFDADKNLYVADSNNFRIQKFFSCPGKIDCLCTTDLFSIHITENTINCFLPLVITTFSNC